MSAMPAEGVVESPTPSGPQPPAPSGSLDMHYYLTEGLEGVEHHKYRDVHSFASAIDSHEDKLRLGEDDEYPVQYVIFSPVTEGQLANIERLRNTLYKRLRFLYLNDPKALVVKIVSSGPHEIAIREFDCLMKQKAIEMGLGRALTCMGGTTYEGNACRKEADGAFRPRLFRPIGTDWPTVVVECGVSESPRRLKVDARWWLENSTGDVKIVLLFYVSRRTRTIRIERWEMGTVPNPRVTRAHPHPTAIKPTIQDTIRIEENTIAGGTLELDFQKIFLRAPVAAREGNFTFTAEELRDLCDHIWDEAQ